MSRDKQYLCNEILTEVKNQMVLLNQCNNKDSGCPNYSWLSRKPRLTSGQREKLEQLTIRLGEAECRTAVMALRAELGTHAELSACDVPIMMCQILQQLVQDHNTANLFSAGMERRHNKPQHQGSTKEVTPQDTIETITKLVEGTTADHATGSRHKMYPLQEEPGLDTLMVHSSCAPAAKTCQPQTQHKDLHK